MTHRLPTWALAVLGAGLLLGLYLSASLMLPGHVDLRRYSSGILDMDVSRVVADVTSARPAYRGSVHPLQKLLLAPLGGLVDRHVFGGSDPLGAARVLIAVFTSVNVLACALLAGLLTGGRRTPALCAGLLAGVSFSSLLAASIPESAAFAALAGVLPLLLLAWRWSRPLGLAEACTWAGALVIGIGLTLTQVVFALIAFGVRLRVSPGARAGARARPAALALALALAGLVAAALLQARLYPGTRPFWTLDPLAGEAPWLRIEALRETPLRHLGRLLAHFGVVDFAAPFPGYSDVLLRSGFDYWSLSLEQAVWTPAQLALGAAVGAAALLAAAAGARSRDPRLLAPALCVAAQFGLHLLYGREYVLFSPHWHGVLVALLVAGAWQGLGSSGLRLLPWGVTLLSALLLVNNLWVLRSIYREVRFGLDAEHRDAEGRLRVRSFNPPALPGPGLPRSPSPPAASDDRPSANGPD